MSLVVDRFSCKHDAQLSQRHRATPQINWKSCWVKSSLRPTITNDCLWDGHPVRNSHRSNSAHLIKKMLFKRFATGKMTLRITGGNSAILDSIRYFQLAICNIHRTWLPVTLKGGLRQLKFRLYMCLFLYSSLSTSQLTWDMFSEISDLESFK